MEYIKRTSKKSRQELLNKALREELEFLRKKIYPWKRHDLLIDDVQIKERRFYLEKDMRGTAGLYEYNEKNYMHNIYVDKTYLINVQKVPIAYYRKYHYSKLRQIIRHELIHAFVQEKWEHKCKYYIEDKHVDASPIFLAILYFVGGLTNHNCLEGFKKTELYDFAKYEADTYKELEEYLNNYLLEIMEQIDKLKEFENKEEFTKKINRDYYCIKNNFKFSPRQCGMYKFSEISSEDIHLQNKLHRGKFICINRTWHIGCNVEPDKIIELYNKKQDCKAQYYFTEKQLIVIPKSKGVTVKDCKFIKIKEEKNY
ncbi:MULTISPECIES: hypothetical protein [Clostridium]|uniref:hypothetical protein n=1 Tax=Clostridium TaxID=1485 RepID=UPI000DFD0313|nr:hypothetical protein [Clostridium sporogenes]MCW6085552.1 hypothetical protein [Clostridium sporogenes]STC76563.1 Uncharacterised protein [Clostridium botulinum]